MTYYDRSDGFWVAYVRAKSQPGCRDPGAGTPSNTKQALQVHHSHLEVELILCWSSSSTWVIKGG